MTIQDLLSVLSYGLTCISFGLAIAVFITTKK